MGDHEGTLQIENDDSSMKTKNILTRLGLPFGTLGCDEKSFFNTLSGLSPSWDYKRTTGNFADYPGVYTSEKILSLITIDKTNLKCRGTNGSMVSGLGQPILFSFVLDKPPG